MNKDNRGFQKLRWLRVRLYVLKSTSSCRRDVCEPCLRELALLPAWSASATPATAVVGAVCGDSLHELVADKLQLLSLPASPNFERTLR